MILRTKFPSIRERLKVWATKSKLRITGFKFSQKKSCLCYDFSGRKLQFKNIRNNEFAKMEGCGEFTYYFFFNKKTLPEFNPGKVPEMGF